MAGEDNVMGYIGGIPSFSKIEDNLHSYTNDVSAVAAGDVVYQDSTVDDKVLIANADNASTNIPVGMVIEVTDTTNCVVCHMGGIATGLSGLTRGADYWLSTTGTTGNTLTITKPLTNAFFVGVALSTSSMLIGITPFDTAGSGSGTLDHAALTSNLAWTSSGHTGTADAVPAFNISGDATELTIGTDIQGFDALLQDIADISGTASTADQVIVSTGSGSFALESGSTLRTSLGLGTGDAVSFSSLTLSTDLALIYGGTGASTDSAARTNLGVAIGSDVQGFDALLQDIADVSGTATTADQVIVSTGVGSFALESGSTLRTSLGLAIGTDVQAQSATLTDIDNAGVVPGDSYFLVGTGVGTLAWETTTTSRTSIGLGTSDSPTFTDLNLSGGNLNFTSAAKIDSTSTIEIESVGSMILDTSTNADISFRHGGVQWLLFDSSLSKIDFSGAGEIETSGNLTLDPTSNNDVIISEGTQVYGTFDGSTQTLALGSGTGASGTKLSIAFDSTTITPVSRIWNGGSNTIAKRILQLDFINDSTTDTNDDYIQFTQAGGAIEVGRIHSEVLYATFTGGHDGQTENPCGVDGYGDFYETINEEDHTWLQGMIVVSTGSMIATGFSRALPYITLATANNEVSVMGVYQGFRTTHTVKDFDLSKEAISYNALGEGQVLVTNFNGDVDLGDLISSSEIEGYGQKQTLNAGLMASHTVAKCTEDVDWANVTDELTHDAINYKWALVGCTYHCG